MNDENLAHTRALLKAWGNWSHNNTGCGWYTQMCGLSNVLPVESDLREKLCDDDALVIDKLVACMGDKENPRPMAFFELFYISGYSKRKIAKVFKCDPMTVGREIANMEYFITGLMMGRETKGFKLKFDK
ncbi:hypothetical protein GOZ68_07540 [Vibrio parahaemolyticus]|nr:hypothetical protein [Vibrio parahaemolyticus]